MSNLRLDGVGFIGRDPEQKQSKNGRSFVTTSAAVTIGYGEQKETVWVSLIAFDESPMRALSAAKKGSLINFTGALRPRLYEKDSQAQIGLDVTVGVVSFVSSGRNNENNGNTGSSGGGSRSFADFEDDSSIPF